MCPTITNVIARSRLALPLLLVCAGIVQAQEIKFIDLSNIRQRTELRSSPAPPSDCVEGQGCVGGGYRGGSVADGGPDIRDPRALGVALDSVVPTDITLDPFQAEFRIINTGLVPLDIPISPHLSDLQPSDEWQVFQYVSLAIEVRLSATGPVQALGLGYVELYGAVEHEDTIITLKPGQWVRVKAKLELHTWPSQPVEARLSGDFRLHRNVYEPHAGGAFTQAVNDYPNHTILPSSITVRYSPTHPASQQRLSKP
ncbi:MAG TPA: hypothetical protein VMU05_16280 [Dongiaceae bacterium]|nr:hypothetical protein [Dongiaceae bacterium]